MSSCPKRIYPIISRQSGESNSEYIERVFGIFHSLIKTLIEEKTYKNKHLSIPKYGDAESGEEYYRAFFDHIIQYNSETGSFNSNRLKYACALPNMLLNCCDARCSYCIEKGQEDNKYSIFCKTHGYVIIIEERKQYFLVYTGIHPEEFNYPKYL